MKATFFEVRRDEIQPWTTEGGEGDDSDELQEEEGDGEGRSLSVSRRVFGRRRGDDRILESLMRLSEPFQSVDEVGGKERKEGKGWALKVTSKSLPPFSSPRQ